MVLSQEEQATLLSAYSTLGHVAPALRHKLRAIVDKLVSDAEQKHETSREAYQTLWAEHEGAKERIRELEFLGWWWDEHEECWSVFT